MDSVLQYLFPSMVMNKSILYSSIYLLHNHATKPIKQGSTIIANRGTPIQQIASTIMYCNHVKPPIRANANPQRVPITATVFVRNFIIISPSFLLVFIPLPNAVRNNRRKHDPQTDKIHNMGKHHIRPNIHQNAHNCVGREQPKYHSNNTIFSLLFHNSLLFRYMGSL